MKTKLKLLVLVAGTLAAGCWSVVYQPSQDSVATQSPQLALEGVRVHGAYEREAGDTVRRAVFLSNGVCEEYVDGVRQEEYKWVIIERKVKVDKNGTGLIFSVESKGDLRWTAAIVDGVRTELDVPDQVNFNKIPLRDMVVGTYEAKIGNTTYKHVFREDGIFEDYGENGEKHSEQKWQIMDEEFVLVINIKGSYIFEFSANRGLTWVAIETEGGRVDLAKKEQITLNKIK